MAVEKVVVALGGNALQQKGVPATAEAQLEVIKKTVEYIAEMSCSGYELAIVHGNGPQVGQIMQAYEAAPGVPAMPFDACGAMSQGYIGYHIQQALGNALKKRKRNVPVTAVITQVVVDREDPAFLEPTKPIGSFYTREEAEALAREKGYLMKEDAAGRGWRRVVASPMPQKIVEFSCLKGMWDTTIVVAAGGGGIPVIEKDDGSLEGIAAVIDKDLAAEKLAENIGADTLLILTEVDKVALNFNRPDQKDLDRMTAAEAERYMEEGHFAPGSMLPKVQAAARFVKGKPGRKAIITSLYKSMEALEGISGTLVTN